MFAPLQHWVLFPHSLGNIKGLPFLVERAIHPLALFVEVWVLPQVARLALVARDAATFAVLSHGRDQKRLVPCRLSPRLLVPLSFVIPFFSLHTP